MKSSISKGRRVVVAAAAFFAAGGVRAEMSAEELAKIAQNPVGNLISVPFQNNTNFNVGPRPVRPAWWSMAFTTINQDRLGTSRSGHA
jgi:hypothetical protein